MFEEDKYQPFPPVSLPNRKWPSKKLKHAPIWCSVDLRDGNQALATPMNLQQKVAFFKMLVRIGFKYIEVGFPAASAVEYEFLQLLQRDNLIPADVTVQVLTQAREDQIRKTIQAIDGLPQAIVHVYNSTSKAQREQVFAKSEEEIIQIAVKAVTLLKELTKTTKTKVILEYSPESFSATELPIALAIGEAVFDAWKPTKQDKAIFNLPATVEMATPNVFADQIEWICEHISHKEALIISLHTHNDRGTSVAASELGLLAGGERIEGSLFGNGERTGNVDLITLAYNLITQGIDPQLSFEPMQEIIDLYTEITKIPVHIRHPYVGELVYTAFSGSHQDAIRKGITYRKEHNLKVWNVPYLPLDPQDINRNYDALVRINSQSGKGGIAYVLEQEYGYFLPKAMQPFVAKKVQEQAEKNAKELSVVEIGTIFEQSFVSLNRPLQLEKLQINQTMEKAATVTSYIVYNGKQYTLEGKGNGVLDAFVKSLQQLPSLFSSIQFLDYSEHSLAKGSDAKAMAYIAMEINETIFWGAGKHTNINYASVYAVISALNQAFAIL